MAIGTEEVEVFGTGKAFSERWVRSHGIDKTIDAVPYLGIPNKFESANALSEILEVGITQESQMRKASLLSETSNDERFRVAFNTGLLPLISVDHAMKSSRIDTTAEALARGPTPQGIAQWLLVDDETRRSLALLFKLVGMEVKDETDPVTGNLIHDNMVGLDTDNKLVGYNTHSFRDVINITPPEIQRYLKVVQEAVGTDPGVVRLAYTIFRTLGFAHENQKYAGDLWGKYWVGVGGDLDTKDIAPFINKFKDPDTDETLGQIIQARGIKGLALALNRQPAEKIAREWKDMNLILDMMDKISDIRKGVGGSASLEPIGRRKSLESLQELNIVLAKRKLSVETINRLFDMRKISGAKPATQQSFLERTLYGAKVPWEETFGKKPSPKG